MNFASEPRERPIVIALHSSGASGRQWAPLAEALARTHRVVAPDFHGHGHGPRVPSERATIVAADTALVAGIVASAPHGVHLVGHSYGGAIALRIARRWASRIHGLTVIEPVAFRLLFDTYGRRKPSAEVIEAARAVRVLVDAGKLERAAEHFVGYWGGDQAWIRLGDEGRTAVSLRMNAIAGHFDGLSAADFVLDDCRRIATPALVLPGTHTRAPALRIAELVASALPDVRDERLPGGTHLEALVAPQRIVGRIASFIGEIEKRALRVAA